ncbi:MAG: hypothetical protein NC124_11430 [Clostridium sp.]|nr:hypothetical protein [Clostridium sp.]
MGITGVGADNVFWNNVLQNSFKAGKGAADKSRDNDYTKEEMLQIISERMEEIYEKVKNNDTETSFQIVLSFLNRVNADADYRFAAKEGFWRDFLNGQVDTEDFVDFLNGAKGEAAGG